MAARLNHPNILALHDSGETNGLQYFVMPHVEGDSLRTRLDRDGPLPVEEALRVAREVGDALAYAHGMGLVHRDIKPENILFQAGHAMVCDFGIAQVAEETKGAVKIVPFYGSQLGSENDAISENRGAAVRKREDTHRMAEANKAFAHYRW